MKRNYYIVALIMLTFFVISFLTNVIGPLSPEFIKDFKLSDLLAGLLPFAFFIAYGVMSIPSSMLVQKYNEKTIMVAAFIVAFIGSLILALQPNYLTAVLSLFLIGCGMAMLQVVINPLLQNGRWRGELCIYICIGTTYFWCGIVYQPAWYILTWLRNINVDNSGHIQYIEIAYSARICHGYHFTGYLRLFVFSCL